ncbi:MAG: MATE family efflux transporter [Clostridia bacterium]|jgi:putative MATE family efflux protein|nr:MATE family efflux transporter [Clostridia bacterium]
MKDNIKNAIITVGIPVMLQNFFETTYSLADSMMLANLSEKTFAGVNLVNQILFILLLIIYGINTALLSNIANAKEHKLNYKKYVGIGITFALIVATIFLGVLKIFQYEIITMFVNTSESEVIYSAIRYMNIASIGYLISCVSVAYLILCRGLKIAKYAADAVAISLLVNIVLNYLFIFKLGYGIEGAAVATVIAKIIELVLVVKLVNKAEKVKIRELFTFTREEFNTQIINNAIPNSIAEGLHVIIGLIVTYVVSRHGIEKLIAFQFAITIYGFFRFISAGIANSSQVVIASAEKDNIIRLLKEFSKIGLIGGFICSGLMNLLVYPYSYISNISNETFGMVINYILILTPIMIIYPIGSVLVRGGLRGINQSRYILKTNVISKYIIGLTLMFLLELTVKNVVLTVFMYYLVTEIVQGYLAYRKLEKEVRNLNNDYIMEV